MKHETLREARKRRGWTIAQLAFASGVDKGTISRIETGVTPNPSSATVASLEIALKVRRGSLVFGEVAA